MVAEIVPSHEGPGAGTHIAVISTGSSFQLRPWLPDRRRIQTRRSRCRCNLTSSTTIRSHRLASLCHQPRLSEFLCNLDLVVPLGRAVGDSCLLGTVHARRFLS